MPAAVKSASFLDGITIWTSQADDAIAVFGSYAPESITAGRSTTVLNTGNGSDYVVVTLVQGQHGYFLVNTGVCSMCIFEILRHDGQYSYACIP